MTSKNVWVDACVRPRTGARGSLYIESKSKCIWATSDEICSAPLVDDEVALRHIRVKYIGSVIWMWGLERVGFSALKSLASNNPVYSMKPGKDEATELRSCSNAVGAVDAIFAALKSDGTLELFAYSDDTIRICSRAIPMKHALRARFKYNGDCVSNLVAIRPGIIVLVVDGHVIAVTYAECRFCESARCGNVTDACSVEWYTAGRESGHDEVVLVRTRLSIVLWNVKEPFGNYISADDISRDMMPISLPRIHDHATITCSQKHPDGGSFLFLDTGTILYVDSTSSIHTVQNINCRAHTTNVLREIFIDEGRTLIVWITSRNQGSCVLALSTRPHPQVRQIINSNSQIDPCADFLVQGSHYTICGGKRSDRAYICKITRGLLITSFQGSQPNLPYKFDRLFPIRNSEGQVEQVFLSRSLGPQFIIDSNPKDRKALEHPNLNVEEPTMLICHNDDMVLYQITEGEIYSYSNSSRQKQSSVTLPHRCDRAVQCAKLHMICVLSYVDDSTQLTLIGQVPHADELAIGSSLQMDNVIVKCVHTLDALLMLGTNRGVFVSRAEITGFSDYPNEANSFMSVLPDLDVEFLRPLCKCSSDSGNNIKEEDNFATADPKTLLILTAQGSLRLYAYTLHSASLELIDSIEIVRHGEFPIVEKVDVLSDDLILISTVQKSILLDLSRLLEGSTSLREAVKEDLSLHDIRSLVFLEDDKVLWLSRSGQLHQGILRVSDPTNAYSMIHFESPDSLTVLTSMEEIDEDSYIASTAPGVMESTNNLGFTIDHCNKILASELLLLKFSGSGIVNTLRFKLADNEIIQKICALDLIKESVCEVVAADKRLFGICTQFADGKGKIYFIAADSEEIVLISEPMILNDAPISMIALNPNTIVIITSERILTYQVAPPTSTASSRSIQVLPPRTTGFIRASSLRGLLNGPLSCSSNISDDHHPSASENPLILTALSQRDLSVQVTDLDRLDDDHVIVSTLLQSCVILKITSKGLIDIETQDTPFLSSVLTLRVLNDEIFVSSRERKQIGLHRIHRFSLDDSLSVTTELYPLEFQINKFRSKKIILPFNDHQESDAIYWLDIEGNIGIIAPIDSEEQFAYLKSLETLVFTKADLIGYDSLENSATSSSSSPSEDFRMIRGQFISVLLEMGSKFQCDVFRSHGPSTERFLDWTEMMRMLMSIRQCY